jgi:hypothetical protein
MTTPASRAGSMLLLAHASAATVTRFLAGSKETGETNSHNEREPWAGRCVPCETKKFPFYFCSHAIRSIAANPFNRQVLGRVLWPIWLKKSQFDCRICGATRAP